MTIVPKMKWVLLGFIIGLLSTNANKLFDRKLNIAVIGAGASGLASTKNILDQKHNVVVFEKSGTLGGIWFYNNETGKDKYGVDIHTPMYQRLRTNTPFDMMDFPDHEFPIGTHSFPTSNAVWDYLDSYANKFNLKKYIKYHHLVKSVVSLENNKWNITVKDVTKNDEETTSTFDAVFVCSGVCSSPHYPNIKDEDKFDGIKMHSHDYRIPDIFAKKNVLVIGGGRSGNDIAFQLSGVAERVTYSTHKPVRKVSALERTLGKFAKMFTGESGGIVIKGDVKYFKSNGAKFSDGTFQIFDVVIFATGYEYSYPFLNKNVGIHTDTFYVHPLYKQILNIEHPTMAFIGIPYSAANNRMYDLQARFALKFISGDKTLPIYSEMLRDDVKKQSKVHNNGTFKPHALGLGHKDYYDDLAKTADIQNIPEYISNIFTYQLEMETSSDPNGIDEFLS